MKPTPFERAVIAILRGHTHSSMGSYHLREALMDRGMGKHPAGVAMNLTRVAWRERFFTCFIDSQNDRNFVLTSDGRDYQEDESHE